jgi:hypothetical protein
MKGLRREGQIAPSPARRTDKTPDSTLDSDEDRETNSDGLGRYRRQPECLIKQLYSVTTSNGNYLRLISYHSRSCLNYHKLPRPTTDPKLCHIVLIEGTYIEQTVYKSLEPVVTRARLRQSPQLQTQGSSGQGRGVCRLFVYSRGYTLTQSLLATFSQPYKSPDPPTPGSEHASLCQNHNRLPHHRPPPASVAHGSPR